MPEPEPLHDALTLDLHEGGVAIATFDLPGAPVNVLGAPAAAAFGALLDRLDRDANIRACVLRSGKRDAWIAGADIEQFAALRDATDAEALSWQGQAMADRVERARVPVVAAIHGACVGGGLEVALACAWRVATEHAKTTFALPEVQLGLIPGMGGTQRLPRRIGLQAALDMILTGKTVRAKRARSLGIVDDLVHPAVLLDIAIRRARELASGEKKRGGMVRTRSATSILVDATPVGRTIVFSRAREQVVRKTGGHYPAPLAALDAVHDGYAHGRDAGLKQEARRFGELAVTSVSRELVYLFHATTALKKDESAMVGARPRRVRQLGVVGGGFMGAGIAALAARRGTPVRLKENDLPRVARAIATVRATLRDALTRRRATALEVAAQQALVMGTAEFTGFRRADLVIEAVFEDLALKRRVIADVERAAPDAILATNTSTIPVTEIADGAVRRDRVVGMHFFSPVAKMPLLEVVRAADTAPEAIATAVAYGRALGKTVIVVGDGPGFYVNRMLAPYLNEAGWLLDAGVPVERIDAALVAWGFPVGPFQLMDEVGFEVAAKAGQVVADAYGTRLTPAPALQRILESGRRGRTGRQGFYQYDTTGRRGGVDPSIYPIAGIRPLSGVALGTEREAPGSAPSPYGAAQIVERTVYPMLDEAVRCLDEGVIASPRDGDVGAVFGIGYPAFRGGPFRTLDALRPTVIVQALDVLARVHPGRFAPGPGLTAMASEGGRAHPRE